MKILGSNESTYESQKIFVVQMTHEELCDLFGFARSYYYKEDKRPEVGKTYKLDGIYVEAKKALELARCGKDAAKALIETANKFLFFFGPEKPEAAK